MRSADAPIAVLLAEDDPDDCLLAIRALQEVQFDGQIETVQDGEELMEYLHQQGRFAEPSAAPRPSLILLDLNMPRKDGREALREIKTDPLLRQIPVVVLTTSSAKDDIKQSYDLGVNAFVTKPFSFEDLTHMLRVLSDFWLKIARLPF